MNGPAQKQTILIVDDDPLNIRILLEILHSDYATKIAINGETALKIAQSDNPPDLILLDIMMPDMDGYSVCKTLKTDKRTSNIPVIFVTAKCNEQDEIQGFEYGAVDYVTKPFNPIVVKVRVRTHIELKKYCDFLENTSYCDVLTTIANRRRFDEYFELMWNLAARGGLPLSLILIDIDHFKLLNDNYGHQAGDVCLTQIAKKLASLVNRKTDLVARYGGEEFICVLPNTKLDDAATIAEKLRNGIQSLQIPHAYSSAGNCVTISLGVATVNPAKDLAPDILIKAADEALYRAKSNGRNRVISTEAAVYSIHGDTI